jgi:hypothetical protein
MIYHFPDLETLQLAITSGVVPTEVSLAPAKGGLDDDGQVWLEPSVALPRKAQTALRRLGVEIVRANGQLEGDEYCCWLQLLPVVRVDNPVPTPQTPVLFELADAAQLPVLVTEMLRLGNDRQGFRWLNDDAGSRVLLRVIGPPYYSLLRALETDGQTPAPRAYVERAPRVWVEFGHTHPLAEKIRPREGRFLLMRPPRDWTFAEDAAFQDVYDILDFQLSEGRVFWRDTEPAGRIRVPLRLAPAGTAEPPELWVLRDNAVDQLDTLVREADDHLLGQLIFAVGEREGQTSIVLKVRASKQAPPTLSIQGESYRPYLRLPNLFLPHGSRLQPPLRRDAVRKLLANEPDQINWLVAQPDGSFRPESLPDASFRPLADWVEYVLDRDQQALTAWIQAAKFDFDSFICKDEQHPAPPKPPASERKRSAKETEEVVEIPQAIPVVAKTPARSKEPAEFVAVPLAKPGELEQRRAELEEKFVEIEGALDAPERQELWPEMAAVNAALNQPADAALCWQHAIWERDAPPPGWARHWAHMEMKGGSLDRLLAGPPASPADVRAVAACVIAHPEAVTPRLAATRRYLEQHETKLGVRSAWLAWVGLTRLSHGDVLGLARARDRLLDRLLARGLSVDHDLPRFLRFSGLRSDDYRKATEGLIDLVGPILAWSDNCSKEVIAHPHHINAKRADPNNTLAYLKLVLAFGLARLGETERSNEIRAAAYKVLGTQDRLHRFLYRSYAARIDQVLGGKNPTEPLPPDLLEELKSITQFPDQNDRPAYKIERLRQASRILEPHERFDPYLRTHGNSNLISAGLTRLADTFDPEQFVPLAQALIQQLPGPSQRAYAVAGVLSLSNRYSEPFAVKLVEEALTLLEQFPKDCKAEDLEAQVRLIDRGLLLSAHFDHRDHVERFIDAFVMLLDIHGTSPTGQEKIAILPQQCFRGLRKLGLKDRTGYLLERMVTVVQNGESLTALQRKHGALWPVTLRTLLAVSAEWLYLGDEARANPVLEAARDLLFGEELVGKARSPEKFRLARAYIAALGQSRVPEAIRRIQELFQRLSPIYEDYLPSTHYFTHQIELVEAVVLAMVSDDFVLGQNARRWLDEDEYLVRRRIHRDLRAVMAQAGM